MKQIAFAFLVAFVFGLGLAYAAEQTGPTLPQALTAALRCQSQFASMQADIVEGKLVTWEQVKKAVEDANPTLTLDVVTHKVATK